MRDKTKAYRIADQQENGSRVRRPATPMVAGVFFAVATGITAVTGISLLLPGSILDAMWRIKPDEHEQLLSAGVPAPVGFCCLSAIMAITSIGAFLRRRWAWWLAIMVFIINGIGDAIRAALGAAVEGVVGVSAVALILFWLTRPCVRATFER
jgi:hypothetical protein